MSGNFNTSTAMQEPWEPQQDYLKQAFRVLYRSSLPLKDTLERIQNDLLNEHTQHLIDFVRSSERGISR